VVTAPLQEHTIFYRTRQSFRSSQDDGQSNGREMVFESSVSWFSCVFAFFVAVSYQSEQFADICFGLPRGELADG